MNERGMEYLRKAIEQAALSAMQAMQDALLFARAGVEPQDVTACIDSMELQMMGIKP